jgi:hypothetical protein
MAFPRGCLPSQEVPSKIKRWLESEEFSCVQIIGELARNTLFSYVVTLSTEIEIVVFQPSDRKDSICLSGALVLSEDQVKRLLQKSKVDQVELFMELQLNLASVDVEFTFEGGEVCRRIGINHTIFFDGLTKDRFFKGISMFNKAYSLASWILKKSL